MDEEMGLRSPTTTGLYKLIYCQNFNQVLFLLSPAARREVLGMITFNAL